MAHMTNKLRIKKERNNRNRGMNGFNTGARDMGKTYNDRKAGVHMKLSTL